MNRIVGLTENNPVDTADGQNALLDRIAKDREIRDHLGRFHRPKFGDTAIGQAQIGIEGMHTVSQHAEKRWINEAIIARITGGAGYRPGDRVCVGLREKQHDHSVIKILAGMRQRLVRKGHEVEQFQLSRRPERG